MSVLQVAAQEPAVAEVVVALDELDAIAALEAQFVGTARGEFVDDKEGVPRARLVDVRARGHGVLSRRLRGRRWMGGRGVRGKTRCWLGSPHGSPRKGHRAEAGRVLERASAMEDRELLGREWRPW